MGELIILYIFKLCSVLVFYLRSISVTLVVKMPVIFFAISKGEEVLSFFFFWSRGWCKKYIYYVGDECPRPPAVNIMNAA